MNSNELFETIPPIDAVKFEGLARLEKYFSNGTHYKDYPATRFQAESIPDPLPPGPWSTRGDDEVPDFQTQQLLLAKGVLLDSLGRPLHPWLTEMVTNPRVGVVTGKGVNYEYSWGPNYTADPIVVRYDQQEPYILMITRGDGGELALPGGFVDPGEDPLIAALREAQEEALFTLGDCQPKITLIYQGVVADIRTAAHSWGETTAYKIELPNEYAARLPLGSWEGEDDAKMAHWVPYSKLPADLYGSHGTLIRLAEI